MFQLGKVNLIEFPSDPILFDGRPCQGGYFPVAAECGVVRRRLPRLVQDGLVLPRQFLDPARDRVSRPLDVGKLAGRRGAKDVLPQCHLQLAMRESHY